MTLLLWETLSIVASQGFLARSVFLFDMAAASVLVCVRAAARHFNLTWSKMHGKYFDPALI